MRTNIDIDDELMAKMLKVSGAPTKKAAVEEALRFFLQLKAQERIRELRGKLKWTGNLEESRQGRDLQVKPKRRKAA